MNRSLILIGLVVLLFLLFSTITGVTIYTNWKEISQTPSMLGITIVALITAGMMTGLTIWVIISRKEIAKNN